MAGKQLVMISSRELRDLQESLPRSMRNTNDRTFQALNRAKLLVEAKIEWEKLHKTSETMVCHSMFCPEVFEFGIHSLDACPANPFLPDYDAEKQAPFIRGAEPPVTSFNSKVFNYYH